MTIFVIVVDKQIDNCTPVTLRVDVLLLIMIIIRLRSDFKRDAISSKRTNVSFYLTIRHGFCPLDVIRALFRFQSLFDKRANIFLSPIDYDLSRDVTLILIQFIKLEWFIYTHM